MHFNLKLLHVCNMLQYIRTYNSWLLYYVLLVWHEATIPVTYLHTVQYVCMCMLFPALHCCGCSLLCVQSALVAHVRTYVCINIHADFISHECRLFLTTSDLHLVASLMRLYSCMMDEIKDSGPDGKPTMQATQVRTYIMMHAYAHTYS